MTLINRSNAHKFLQKFNPVSQAIDNRKGLF
jgi:hypothetical protein